MYAVKGSVDLGLNVDLELSVKITRCGYSIYMSLVKMVLVPPLKQNSLISLL